MGKSVSVTALYDILYGSPARCLVWDSLWNNKSIARIAVAVHPNAQRIDRARERANIRLCEAINKPGNWSPQWDEGIVSQLHSFLAASEIESDFFPALAVPRDVHSESQGIADIFGARVELQDTGNTYVYPLAPDPVVIDDIILKPIRESKYWGAVEWIRYAHGTTGGIECRFPVMTGPLDTANYLLGTTTLLEWVYTHPETLHRLLAKIASVIIEMASAIREAAGGTVHSHHFVCTRGGLDFCSEVRSLISLEMYAQFEAPYLRRIGEALGPYGIHSCGNFERTIPNSLADPNLRVMNGQIKENDLTNLCELAAGKLTLSIGPSVYVHDQFMWEDAESFYRHVIETVPYTQPFEILVYEDDFMLWKKLNGE